MVVLVFVFLLTVVLMVQICGSNTVIRTVAGIPPFGGDEKLATTAYMSEPSGLHVTTKNEIYIADSLNQVIRKVDKNGIISTLAGIPGRRGHSGDDELAVNAKLSNPVCVFVVEETNELFFCEFGYGAIRKIALHNGTISTIVYCSKFKDQPCLYFPNSLFVKNNEIYICDSMNRVIRKMFQNGTIAIIAGKLNVQGNDGDGGEATNANKNIRKLFANNTITTLVGRTNPVPLDDDSMVSISPCSVFVDEESNEIYMVDQNSVKKLVNDTTVITITGRPNSIGYSGDNHQAKEAFLNNPTGVFVTPQKEVFIADTNNNVIRKIDTSGVIHTVAGYNIRQDESDENIKLSSLYDPDSIWVADENVIFVAELKQIKRIQKQNISIILPVWKPTSLFLNEKSHELLFIASQDNQIFSYHLLSEKVSLIAGNGLQNDTGRLPTQIALKNPSSIFLTGTELYIADSGHSVIRKIFLNNQSSSIVAGTFNVDGYSGDGGLALNATLREIKSITVSSLNDLYIVHRYAGQFNFQVVRKVFSNGTIITYLNQEDTFWNSNLQSSCIDQLRNIMYLVDSFAIWKVFLNNDTIVRIAGEIHESGFSSENIDPLKASFKRASSCSVSSTGILYIVDKGAKIIRKINTLCQHYTFDSSLTISEQSMGKVKLQSQIYRTCFSHSTDVFDVDYLPLLSLQSNYFTDTPWKDIVADWNSPLKYEPTLNSRKLDTVSILLNACSDKFGIVNNCSHRVEYSVIPEAKQDSFVLLTGDTNVVQFINFYEFSPSVVNLYITLEFYKGIELERKESIYPLIIGQKKTVTIFGLRPSTLYSVTITSFVEYENQLQFQVQVNKTVQTGQKYINKAAAQIMSITETEIGLDVSWETYDMFCNSKSANLTLYLWNNTTKWEKDVNFNVNNIPKNTTIPISMFSSTADSVYYIVVQICCDEWQHCISSTTDSYLYRPYSLSPLVYLWFLLPISIILLIISSQLVSCGICIIVTIVFRKTKRQYKTVSDEINAQELQQFSIDESKLDLSSSVLLGSGASGSVLTAKYFNMEVAVKLFSKTVMGGLENDLQDFKNELLFLKNNAQHNNIIRYFGTYENNNAFGLVMEFCSKGTLAHYISKYVISFEEKLRILQGIASGMQYLHFHNIAHRDLKCENVLLDAMLTPKIIDFGYSRIICERSNQSLHLTMNVGTAAYCAPEVIKGQVESPFSNRSTQNYSNSLQEPLLQNENDVKTKKITSLAYDKRCDVYSFAIVMYVVYFQNKHPYGKVTDNQILLQMASNTQFRPKVDTSNVPFNELWFIELMKQCWSSDPKQRPLFEQIFSRLNSDHH